MTDAIIRPQRGEIWDVDFDPTDSIQSEEIEKQRPAVVLSETEFVHEGLMIVVPILGYKSRYNESFWFIDLPPTSESGLTKRSVADSSQVKSVSIYQRFVRKRGEVTPEQLKEITAAVALCIGYQEGN